ncbi:hypothetical protein, partial [Pseudomonas aeruginosa]
MPPIDDPFGTPAGGGNGSPPDDRTMIMPRPGGDRPERLRELLETLLGS